ncbi:class I SAM-dependent methyltransferase [Pseudomonas sp. GV071]|jgi:SAM-dependent methyltransferase|uniref:class I SAM-dependent DNA methyltransferase n=1 Tax=Pseudomonas sp. GV071 TaxID=2135754 RepID=UPI000D3B480C|nr:class I SAM-dependent methyltransferase [Pseudomonas sp. GV071]PTQ68406.1 nodulation protein S (NodS) [Pseudomonas sp. GV071]
MSVADSYFEGMFRADADPWAMRTRWYERRKRYLSLASLPQRRYASVLELGCANGELSARLAARSDQLLCCDTSPTALDLARSRLQARPNVQFWQGRLPKEWPPGKFDLIVFSELGYYLDSNDLTQLIVSMRYALNPGGTVLACHWRPAIDGCPHTGDQVHHELHHLLRMPRLVWHQEADLLLEVWCENPTSVAEQEGLIRRAT